MRSLLTRTSGMSTLVQPGNCLRELPGLPHCEERLTSTPDPHLPKSGTTSCPSKIMFPLGKGVSLKEGRLDTGSRSGDTCGGLRVEEYHPLFGFATPAFCFQPTETLYQLLRKLGCYQCWHYVWHSSSHFVTMGKGQKFKSH